VSVQAENPTGNATATFRVALEGVVYTLVDVHDGHDAQFEDWYENDHFYAGGVLAPYVLSGRRWYASQALRESRFTSPACPLPDPRAGTNLATYFVTAGGLRSFYEWINPQLVTLRSGGRMFADRTHVNTDGYRLERVLSFPGASAVPAHVVGDHPFAGLFVAYLDASGDGPAEARAAGARAPGARAAGARAASARAAGARAAGARAANARAANDSAVLPAGTLALSLRPNAGSLTQDSLGLAATQPGMEFPAVGGTPVRLVLAFLTQPPPADPEWSAGLARRVGRLTGSAAVWGGGFRPVVPGDRSHLAHIRSKDSI